MQTSQLYVSPTVCPCTFDPTCRTLCYFPSHLTTFLYMCLVQLVPTLLSHCHQPNTTSFSRTQPPSPSPRQTPPLWPGPFRTTCISVQPSPSGRFLAVLADQGVVLLQKERGYRYRDSGGGTGLKGARTPLILDCGATLDRFRVPLSASSPSTVCGSCQLLGEPLTDASVSTHLGHVLKQLQHDQYHGTQISRTSIFRDVGVWLAHALIASKISSSQSARANSFGTAPGSCELPYFDIKFLCAI